MHFHLYRRDLGDPQPNCATVEQQVNLDGKKQKGRGGKRRDNVIEHAKANLSRMRYKPNMARVMLSKPLNLGKHLTHILCFCSVISQKKTKITSKQKEVHLQGKS